MEKALLEFLIRHAGENIDIHAGIKSYDEAKPSDLSASFFIKDIAGEISELCQVISNEFVARRMSEWVARSGWLDSVQQGFVDYHSPHVWLQAENGERFHYAYEQHRCNYLERKAIIGTGTDATEVMLRKRIDADCAAWVVVTCGKFKGDAFQSEEFDDPLFLARAMSDRYHIPVIVCGSGGGEHFGGQSYLLDGLATTTSSASGEAVSTMVVEEDDPWII